MVEGLETQLEKAQAQLSESQQVTQNQTIELGQLREHFAASEQAKQQATTAREEGIKLRGVIEGIQQA